MKTVEILDRACASTLAVDGDGFALGADRLHAARVYCGIDAEEVPDGSAQELQRWRLCHEFARLARQEKVSPAEVAKEVEQLGLYAI